MHFLTQLLKHPVATGAITPSSKKLSELIANTANLNTKHCVVELGSGTGVFTKEILKRISSTCTFFSLEINDEFVKKTRMNNPKATVHHASAQDIKKYLNQYNENNSDCIISGLPWAVFNEKLQEELLEEIYDSLEQKGEFLTIAHLQGLLFPPGRKFQKLLTKRFHKVQKTKIIWGNIFPAFVYHCIK